MTSPSKPPPSTQKPQTRRGKGRPQASGDATVGREAVIAAARKMLKHLPPLRISRAEVARAAGADPGLIRYYFGNKSSLISAVVLEVANELRENMNRVDPGASLRERLRQRIAALVQILLESPYMHSLLLHRIVYGEAHDEEETALIREQMIFRPLGVLKGLIDEGVASGEFRPVDTNMLHMALIGLCEFPVVAYPLFGLLEGHEDDRSATLARYMDFVADLLVSGIAVRPFAAG